MPTLIPVDHDPFAPLSGAPRRPTLVPVDHDPFAEAAALAAAKAAPLPAVDEFGRVMDDAASPQARSDLGKMAYQAADALTFGLGPKAFALGRSLGGSAPDYATAAAQEKKALDDFKAEQPIPAYAAQAAGAIGGGLGLARAGVTVAPKIAKLLGGGSLGRMAGVAAEGGLYGAADAAGHSDGLADVPVNAAAGAGIGVAAGTGLFGLGSALGAGYRAIAPYARGTVDGVSSAASRVLGGAVERAPGLSSQLADLGPQATLADAGPAFRGMMGRVVEDGGPAGDRLLRSFRNREAGSTDRVTAALTENLGPEVRPSQAAAQFNTMRQAGGRLYEPALREARPIDISGVLADIGTRLNTAAGPERAALLRARSELMAEGANGLAPITNAERLHNAKGALDSLIEYGDTAAGIPAAAISKADGAMRQVRGALNAALEEQVPGYANANLATRTPIRARAALDAAGDVLDTGKSAIHPDDFAERLAGMPMEQQAATRIGVRADLARRQGTGGLAGVEDAFGPTDGFNARKLSGLFGREETDALGGVVHRERTFAETAAAAEAAASRGGQRAGASALDPIQVPEPPAQATAFGSGLKALAAGPRRVANAMLGMRAAGVRDEVGTVLGLTGEPRDEIVRALVGAMQARGAQAEAIRGAVTHQGVVAALTEGVGGHRPMLLRVTPRAQPAYR